jgi:low temperature requirement protein LtrA
MADRPSLLRDRTTGHAPVSYLELFFDLVYVFAITQLSHFLHHHLNWRGFIEGITLFLAIWWAWVYTTWAANWADPERLPVRIMLLVLMLVSLVMSVFLPEAYGADGLGFAASYVALQLGRTAFMVWAFYRDPSANARNMVRIWIWFAASAIFWIFGALQMPDDRLAWWSLALLIEFLGPFCFFYVPLMGRSTASDWDISGGHMAERCALFIIIALGEGIIVTGSSFAQGAAQSGIAAAFALAFTGSVLMWWLYFDLGAERGARHIENHAEPGRVARNAYTYLHMPIVAGIVISAVADALLLEEWNEPASGRLVLTTCGGLLAYLAGLGLFKRFSSRFGNIPLSHQFGVSLLVLLAVVGWTQPVPALAFYGGSVAILGVVALWEWGSFHGGWAERWEALKGGSRR